MFRKHKSLSYIYTPQNDMLSRLKLSWNASSIKYLGIKITKDISKLSDSNYGP